MSTTNASDAPGASETTSGKVPDAKFDGYAAEYDRLLTQSISASGEGKEYFLEYKLSCLKRLGIAPDEPILDYGCGIGNLTGHLTNYYSEVAGYDPSQESLGLARERHPRARFHADPAEIPASTFGAAVLSGVLHHVPPAQRHDVLQRVLEKLRPGGRVVIFEHNPYNPVTRRAVAACEFDDDAILLPPRELRGLLASAGYSAVKLEYIVFFPRLLARLRPLEPKLSWLFLGAQTMTVGTRPLVTLP